MTTVACGGGPSLDQRRAFAALRDGTHVPGYRGYCPQIKYRVGKTYGTDTHILAQEVQHRHPASILAPSTPQPPKLLPESTGDNKYTKNMVPGYTGYIPRIPFKFGDTYKEDCDYCIDEYLTFRKGYDHKQADLWQQINNHPRLTAISYDPEVKEKLNMYRDTHPTRSILVEDKRALTEPPIPGYRGYIPRIKATEMGLGCRYNQTTKKGLELFVQETAANAARSTGKLPQSLSTVSHQTLKSAPPSFNRRLYVNDGMIPKYTGYVPHRRFVFGNTYGDTTRSLTVCGHPSPSYGEFLRSKTTL